MNTRAIITPKGCGIDSSPLAQIPPAGEAQSENKSADDKRLSDSLPAQPGFDAEHQSPSKHRCSQYHQDNRHGFSELYQHQAAAGLAVELWIRFFRSTSILNCSGNSHPPVSARIFSWLASQSCQMGQSNPVRGRFQQSNPCASLRLRDTIVVAFSGTISAQYLMAEIIAAHLNRFGQSW
jgi:hypothetical protein